LKKAVARGFKVSVISTVSRMNLEHLGRMPELLAGLGVTRFFIQVIGLRGKSAAGGNDLQLTPQEWMTAVPPVAKRAAELGMHVIFPKVFLDEGEEFQCAGKCAENYFIFPNGRVYSCPLCEDYPLHSLEIKEGRLVKRTGLTEAGFFQLNIAEGCVMNRLLQPGNLEYDEKGRPRHRISCCLLKQEALPRYGQV
jgi:MoaA/NifB/PqqE/SkfB family radical SAM enzyme